MEACLCFPVLDHHGFPAPQNPFQLVLRSMGRPQHSLPDVVVETGHPNYGFLLNTVRRKRR